MGKNYDRLNLFERIEIEKHLSHNLSYSEIARLINRSKSTIQREVMKQGRSKYEAIQGTWIHTSNQSNRRSGKSKIKLNPKLEKYVMDKLALRWSPEQISTKLKLCYPLDTSMQLSHESIYMYIYVHAKPEQLLCNKGEVLIVRKVTGKNAIWPVYVSHEHIADRSFGVTLDEIELEDDE